MFRAFNSMQFVGLFVALPYLLDLLETHPIRFSSALWWFGAVVYVIMAILTIVSIYHSSKEWT